MENVIDKQFACLQKNKFVYEQRIYISIYIYMYKKVVQSNTRVFFKLRI